MGSLGDIHMAIKKDTLYISCRTFDHTVNAVYAFDIYNPHTPKFVYRHDGFRPDSIMVDERNFIYVWDRDSNSIHQLTDSGQLVDIHKVSSIPHRIFYDDQHGLLYTTSIGSNVITVYRLEYSHPPDSVIPAEVLKMDARSLQIYKEALNEGKEKAYNIRVMVVGQYGVGKTTLTQRLLGENVNILERHSTDGIDVHVECCKISLPAGEWTTQEKNAEQYSRLQRLVKFLNEHTQKQESKSEQDGQSEFDGQVTSEDQDNGHHHHDQPVSAEPGTNQEVKPPTSQSVDSPIARVVPEASSERVIKEKQKDTVMEILQLVNENSGNLEKSIVKYAALALWDFAGQYVFYTTHQTFLTCRAIYLLVIDLSQQVTDLIKDDECFLDMEGIQLCKVHDLIEIWMNSIHSCTPSSHPGIPYVILVGTHVDKIPENCRQRVIDEYFIHVCKILSNKPAASHIMDCIAIDNTRDDPSLEQLKKRIFELAKKQPHWGEEKPARWLPLEQGIMTLKASGVKVAPLSLIEEINRSGSVRIENRDELELFLRYHHEMGTILYFSIEGLREKILLDPQWLIDAQKSLITARTFIDKIPAIVSKWSELEKSGILTYELIDAVWSKEKNPEFHDNKDHIILLMEKLNIIARARTCDQDGKEVKEENYFFTPCMLRDTAPEEVISPKPLSDMESSSVLCYVFTEQFLPTPIFHRLLAACVARWPVAKKNSEILIYCGCCMFKLDLHHRLTVFFRGHVIFVRVTRMGTSEKTPSSTLCIEVKEFVTLILANIIGNLEQSLKFELFIQCPKSSGYSINSLFPVADLQSHIDVPCDSHGDGHLIKSSEVLKFWFEEESEGCAQMQGNNRNVSSLSEEDEDESSVVPDDPITQEHINHFRLCNALTTVCADALREILLTQFPAPHTNICQALLASQTILTKGGTKGGKKQKALLNQDQRQLVFPDPKGRYIGAVEQYDITLLYTLIRNVSSVPAPTPCWGSPPTDNPRDTSLGASVERIRLYRNSISGHSADGKIDQQKFEDYWNLIDSVLQDIENKIGDHGYKEELEKRRIQVITPHEAREKRQKIRDYIKAIKEKIVSDLDALAEAANA